MRKIIKNYKLIENEEQNDFYDPRKSNNGGGYHQPFYKYQLETYENKFLELIISDTSCGDFGSRIRIEVVNDENNIIADAYYGSMLKNDELSSSFDKNNDFHMEIIEILEECGYPWVPTSNDFE